MSADKWRPFCKGGWVQENNDTSRDFTDHYEWYIWVAAMHDRILHAVQNASLGNILCIYPYHDVPVILCDIVMLVHKIMDI